MSTQRWERCWHAGGSVLMLLAIGSLSGCGNELSYGELRQLGGPPEQLLSPFSEISRNKRLPLLRQRLKRHSYLNSQNSLLRHLTTG